MTQFKIYILSLFLLSNLNAADDKGTAVDTSYENIKTSSFKGATQAAAIKTAYDNVKCPNTRVKLIGEGICSESTSNLETKLWECVVIYSCTNE